MDILETVTQLSSIILFWQGLCNGNVAVLGKVLVYFIASENTRMPKMKHLIIYQLLNAFFFFFFLSEWVLEYHVCLEYCSYSMGKVPLFVECRKNSHLNLFL